MPAAPKSKPKRYPLPKRFNVAMSDEAYAKLRALNERWGLGNNYLLEVLLMRLEDFADPAKLDEAYREFIAEYGAPKPGGGMGKTV